MMDSYHWIGGIVISTFHFGFVNIVSAFSISSNSTVSFVYINVTINVISIS